MDKTRLDAVLSKVQTAPNVETCSINVEELGLLQAFLLARQDGSELTSQEITLCGKISDAINHWHRQTTQTQGGGEKRTQLELRNAIDKVLGNKCEELSEDEAMLLRGTYSALSVKSGNGSGEDRLCQLLEKAVTAYDVYLESRPPVDPDASKSLFTPADSPAPNGTLDKSQGRRADKPTAEATSNVVQAVKFFQSVAPSPVKFVEGCDLNVRVRVFEIEGPVKIVGDVPSDVLLTVTKGSIAVEGSVSGNVVAAGNIVIEGNAVQGAWIISRTGDISVESALLKTHVVAKGGSVWCGRVEGAECVFGWEHVFVEKYCIASKLASRSITVDGKVSASTIVACGQVRLGAVESSTRGPSIICLAKEVTSEVYGRPISERCRQLRRNLTQFEKTIKTNNSAMKFTRQVIHSSYRTGIMFLAGGVEMGSLGPELQGLQNLSLYLSQIIDVAESVISTYSPIAEANAPIDSEELDHFTKATQGALTYLSSQVRMLPSEYGATYNTQLVNACDALSHAITRLEHDIVKEGGKKYFREQFVRMVSDWREVRNQANRKVDVILSQSNIDPKLLARLDNEPNSLEGLMDEMIARYSSRDASQERFRSKSPLLNVIKRTVSLSRRGVKDLERQIENASTESSSIRSKLIKDGIVLFVDAKPHSCMVLASSYAPDTVITSSIEKTDGIDCNLGEVITLANAITTPSLFVLQDSVIRRIRGSGTAQ